MSNFLLRRNDGQDLQIRQVHRHEIEPALRLILAGSGGVGTDDAVLEFLSMSVQRGLDLNSVWVVVDYAENILWAVLPMPLAGRAMLLLVPPRLRPAVSSAHVAEMINGALLDPRHRGITMAQALVDPEHRAVHRALREAGFEDIAELTYLSRQVREPLAGRIVPEKYKLWQYDASTHARFSRCIERSYIDSLDCPDLSGRRDMQDIIAGHKAAGEFDPELWTLVSDLHHRDLGTILLNRLQRREGFELVYIGLAPEARGTGLADVLMRAAMNRLALEGGGLLVTACDSNNAPARKLYHRHGFGYLYTRHALVKELRPPTSQTRNVIETAARLLEHFPDELG